MKVIYVAGPYRVYTGQSEININGIRENIEHARRVALQLWKAGWAVICPHMNTAFMDGACPDKVWLNGDLEILKRCDAICMLHNWEESKGAIEEYKLADKLGLHILYETVKGLIYHG